MSRARFAFPIFLALLGAQNAGAGAEAYFLNNVYPVLQKANCRACHVENGVASATRLHFPDPSATPEQIEAFGIGMAVLVDRHHREQSVLVTKPTNRQKHTGGKLIAPGSQEEAALLAWIDQLAGLSPAELSRAASKKPGITPAFMRRLTHSQYNNTVRDLLGDQTSPANQFPQEDFVNGFKNQVEAQSIPALLAESYSAAAEKLARNAFRGGDSNGLIPCKPRSAEDVDCRSRFINGFGLKAFRRPLAKAEAARYLNLFAGELKRSGQFLSAAQLLVEAMLQSPAFLFRVEGADPALRQYETAGRLSYVLWDSMPDEQLFQAAAAGRLGTPAEIEKAARRLLADRRAGDSINEFVSQWLRFDRVLNTVKDRRLFPLFTPELAASMTEETRRLITDAIWNDRNFMTIFSADYSFLNTDLATLYQLPAPNTEFSRIELPPDSERAGIIGQATFLALTSKPADTSPTARGLFVREQFLCQHVPDPPPGTNSNLPALTEDKPQTNRQRLSVHLTKESCAGCHKLIDPIGFGFEKFDAIGARRDKLKLTFFPERKERKKEPKTVHLDLDTTGSISGIQNSDFSSPRELGKVLAENPQCQQCIVKQLFRFAYGRHETPADRPVIQTAFETFKDSQFRFKELMIAISTAYAIRN